MVEISLVDKPRGGGGSRALPGASGCGLPKLNLPSPAGWRLAAVPPMFASTNPTGRPMHYRFLAGLIATTVLLAGQAARAEDLTPLLTKAMEGSKVPAMGVLVIRDGKVAGEAVRGLRRIDAADPVKDSDVWHLGSDGKAMTVTMVARLVERGDLSWTTPLEAMLPELAATMNPRYRKVTLVQLLSHHSGLPHDIVDEATVKTMFAPAPGMSLPRQRLRYIARALRDAPVGPTTDFNYSNTGLLIAGVIAERREGAAFETLMRREVFRPLGMTHVGFGLTHAGQPMGHLAGHVAAPADGNPNFFAPAGNMFMPLSDWALFCIDQLDGAKGHGRLLKPATYQLMQTAQPGGGGLGWGVQAKIAGRQGPALVHAGSDGTWYALVALFPKTGSGVLVTANAAEDMGGDKADKAAFKAVVDTLSPPAP
jgi:CubicO group peptidase (beta-lactamase class C family)